MPPALNYPDEWHLPSTPVQVRTRATPASTPSTTYHGTPRSRSGGTHSVKRQKIRHTPVYISPEQLKAERSGLLGGHHQGYRQGHYQEFDPNFAIDSNTWSQNLRRNRRTFSPGNSPTRMGRTTNRPGSLGHQESPEGPKEYANCSGILEVMPAAEEIPPVRTSRARVMIPPYDPMIPMHSVSEASRYRTRSVPIYMQDPPTGFEAEDEDDYGEFEEFSSKERRRRPDSGSEDELSRGGFPSDEATRHRDTATRRRSQRLVSQKTSLRKLHESTSESKMSSTDDDSIEDKQQQQLHSTQSHHSSSLRLPRSKRAVPVVIDLGDDDDDKPDKSDDSPDYWSEKNLKWKNNWRHTVSYGERPNISLVQKKDIRNLDKRQWLNDSLIEFYLRWLEKHQQPEKIYIFNTFFWKNLTSKTTGNQRINYKAVRNWTSRRNMQIDLFSYDYIIVPINDEGEHWYLAIICNPSKLLAPKEVADSGPSQEIAAQAVEGDTFLNRKKRKLGPPIRKYDPSQPRIMTLDSWKGSKHSRACTKLKDYLIAEAQATKNVQVNWPEAIGMSASGIPFQTNGWDCGVFLCSYVEEFLKQPREMARKIMQKEALEPIVFQKPSVLRNIIRDRLFEVQEEQNAKDDAKKAEKDAEKPPKTTYET